MVQLRARELINLILGNMEASPMELHHLRGGTDLRSLILQWVAWEWG